MYYCLWCDEELIIQLRWSNVFDVKKPYRICPQCWSNFQKVQEIKCQVCSRPNVKRICHDCKQWSKFYDGKDPLIKNISLFTYNSFMKEVITRWKYQGDYILGEMFGTTFQTIFKKTFPSLRKKAIIVPIPLSKERSIERGFNQATSLATYLTECPQMLLARHHHEKQAKKTRMQRMMTKNPFYLKNTLNKPVILVDDIYTTGRTVRHAATLLKDNGCPEVYAYTLIRG